ncbi:MAG: glycosyltransferase [Lachnospiraceae bacterium]|nr:glycosyltransferase [Lachnospiraceae bacterium]
MGKDGIKNEIVFFINTYGAKFGGMESHQKNFIKYFTEKNARYFIKYIADKGEKYRILYQGNCVVETDSVMEIADWMRENTENMIYVFNNMAWIEEIAKIRGSVPNRMVLRSGGNDLLRAPVYDDTVPLLQRQKDIVNIINQSIDCFVVNSDFSYLQSVKQGICARKIKKLRGGVDQELCLWGMSQAENSRACFDKIHGTKGKKIFTVACRHVRFKGILETLYELEKIKDKKNWFFLLIGDGELHGEIRDFLKKNFDDSMYCLTGALSNEDTIRYICISDVLLNCSMYYLRTCGDGSYYHTETMGRTMMEALCCNVPIIATDVGGTSEIFLENKDPGILIQKHDELSGAIENICGQENYHVSIEQDYSWDRLSRSYMDLFDMLAEKSCKNIYAFDLDGTILGGTDEDAVRIFLKTHKRNNIYIINTAREMDDKMEAFFREIEGDYLIMQNGLKVYSKEHQTRVWNDMAEDYIANDSSLSEICSMLEEKIEEPVKMTHPNVISIRLTKYSDMDYLNNLTDYILSKYHQYIKYTSKRFIKIVHTFFNKRAALHFCLKNLNYRHLIAAGNGIHDLGAVSSADYSFMSEEFAYTEIENMLFFNKEQVGLPVIEMMFSVAGKQI